MVSGKTHVVESEKIVVASVKSSEEMTFKRAAIAIVIGAVLIVLIAFTVRHTEMVTGRYIQMGVPPLPAFAAVLILSLLSPVIRRKYPRLAATRAQILLIYCMLTVATILNGSYHIRAFLPHLVSMQYWGNHGSSIGQYARFLPKWYAPHDQKVINAYFDGSANKAVPWDAWIVPLFWWSLFLGAIFIGVLCLVSLVQRRWIREEKLTFPLLEIPLSMTSRDWSIYGSAKSRKTLFIFGLAVAGAFNGLNILHVFVPGIPAPGFYKMMGEYFPNRPWTPLGSISLLYMLETIGIGYFMPLDFTFSTWFFYLLNRLVAVAGSAAGYDNTGFPYTMDVATGGYIAVGLALLWGLRCTFKDSLKQVFCLSDRTKDTNTQRLSWAGLVFSIIFVLAFCCKAGLSIWLALPFFAILGIFVLVYMRMRAETGIPNGFIYPYGMPKEMLLNAASIPTALGFGPQSFVIFSSLAWLSRHHFAEEQAAYQMDAAKLSEGNKIPVRTLVVALILAFAVGLLAAYWCHLSAYYHLGSNMAGGGGGNGEFRAGIARQEYEQMASRISSPPARDISRIMANGVGFLLVGLLAIIRQRVVGFPFHPLGFLMATSYGDGSAVWFPLFISWFCKATILRFGGMSLYRRGMPFFLGLTIGHFFFAGVLWPVLALLAAPGASQAYHLYFGG